MKQKVDIENWVRKEQFKFFSQFEEPYYGVCVTIDCTVAYQFAKQNGISFFLYYLYQAIAATQTVEAFRYRIEGEDVFLYDQINGGSTVARSNGTFGFGYFNYYPSFETFLENAMPEIERVQNTNDLTRSSATNLIRCSALPWLDFTSLSHARMFSKKDSCPWISFGKMTENGGRKTMPVSIHVHHALVDGLHVGQFVDSFQQLMNS